MDISSLSFAFSIFLLQRENFNYSKRISYQEKQTYNFSISTRDFLLFKLFIKIFIVFFYIAKKVQLFKTNFSIFFRSQIMKIVEVVVD